MVLSTTPYALVVDDDAMILMHACDILEEAGFRFYEAATGDDAKTLLAEHASSVTLLFSDVEMPGETDGFALARYVDENWPWIEIVIASGRVTPIDGDMPDKATFIRKPFNNQMVLEHLRETLPRRQEARAPAANGLKNVIARKLVGKIRHPAMDAVRCIGEALATNGFYRRQPAGGRHFGTWPHWKLS